MKGAFRRYNLVLLTLLASVILAICGLAAYMEPLSGDLTRIGGYLENDYGWQGEQDCFAEPLFTWASSIAEYDRYYDVVLLGDSFSKPTRVGGWQNYLIATTGLAMIAFSTEDCSLPTVLGSEGYLNHPPRVFIYQLVERNLWFDHRTFVPRADQLLTAPTSRNAGLLACTPLAVEPTPRPRHMSTGGWPSIDLDAASSYLYKATLRYFFDLNLTQTVRIELARGGLFSSRSSHSLLIYDDDLLKAGVKRADITLIAASIAARAGRAESNGLTRFMTLIAPDKLTAYSDFIDPEYRDLSIIPALAEEPGLNLIRLDTPLRAAIRNGEIDVYLPNDTHWGEAGCQIVAREVKARMIAQGILRPAGR